MQLYQTATFKSNLRNKTSSLLGHVPSFLITLPPVTGLTILTVSRKTIINKHCVCTGHKKEKWILCSTMFYFTTWMMKDTAQDCTRSKRYAHSLKHEHVPTTTHPVVCHSTSKMVPKKRKVSRNTRFCHKHTQSSCGSKQTSPRHQQELL